MKAISIFTDGGSRGNPGPAAYGVYIVDENQKELAGFGQTLGETTNNVAEYKGLLAAFDWLLSHAEIITGATIQFFLDSKLVCSQMQGTFRVKDPMMQQLFVAAKMKERSLNATIAYTHIPREKNTKADSFVNAALDNLL
ncbi:MAG: ribonuclease HI family protein [Candidatus Levyibacteriota bacterium]